MNDATPNEAMLAIPGLTVRSDDIASTTELAASIYLVQNEGRADNEWDPLPDSLTAEDIRAAHRRAEARRSATRHACTKHAAELSAPLPVPRRCAIDSCDNLTHKLICKECEERIEATGDRGSCETISDKALRVAVVISSITIAAVVLIYYWVRSHG